MSAVQHHQNYYQTAYAQAPRYNYTDASNYSSVSNPRQYSTAEFNNYQPVNVNHLRQKSTANLTNNNLPSNIQYSNPKPHPHGAYQITIAVKSSNDPLKDLNGYRQGQVIDTPITLPTSQAVLPATRPSLPPVVPPPAAQAALPPKPPSSTASSRPAAPSQVASTITPPAKPAASKDPKSCDSKSKQSIDGKKEVTRDEFNLKLLKEILEAVGDVESDSESSSDDELTVADLLELLECLKAKKHKKKKHHSKRSNKNKIFEKLLA